MNLKFYLLTAIASLAAISATAQSVVQDSVTLGPQYRDQVYYSMQSGTVHGEALADWDIAFEITGYTASIITNGGAGAALYLVPNKTAADWSGAVDTTGLSSTWSRYDNSTESWSVGAFNMDRDASTGDFGWGEYNLTTHAVTATSLFVVKLVDGSWRKVMIDGLVGGVYTFHYANLDGTNEKSGTIAKTDFAGKHFGYYSLVNGASVDREPNSDSWDLVFGKYITMLDGGTGLIPYGVTGVLGNQGVEVAEVKSGNAANEPAPGSDAFTDSIARIGYDWKSFNGSSYVVNDSAVYFVRNGSGSIYRLRFTGFSGSSTGVFRFEKSALVVARVGTEDAVAGEFAIYPNIIGRHGALTIVHGLIREAGAARFDLYDIKGSLVRSLPLSGDQGLHQQQLGLDLPAGSYIATITVDGRRASQRLIVQ